MCFVFIFNSDNPLDSYQGSKIKQDITDADRFRRPWGKSPMQVKQAEHFLPTPFRIAQNTFKLFHGAIFLQSF